MYSYVYDVYLYHISPSLALMKISSLGILFYIFQKELHSNVAYVSKIYYHAPCKDCTLTLKILHVCAFKLCVRETGRL